MIAIIPTTAEYIPCTINQDAQPTQTDARAAPGQAMDTEPTGARRVLGPDSRAPHDSEVDDPFYHAVSHLHTGRYTGVIDICYSDDDMLEMRERDALATVCTESYSIQHIQTSELQCVHVHWNKGGPMKIGHEPLP
ncbi:hypothetical protein NM688_g5128 [Phlebia brevispora]|uniref:Uncharacterized protein n=1 Tax=Phlebia brevispora TaxID=194682 RepID=A0ACC1T0B6_9APHY|nr:hypothetical protein NM688_g5128 [Phlebia brevispora]